MDNKNNNIRNRLISELKNGLEMSYSNRSIEIQESSHLKNNININIKHELRDELKDELRNELRMKSYLKRIETPKSQDSYSYSRIMR